MTTIIIAIVIDDDDDDDNEDNDDNNNSSRSDRSHKILIVQNKKGSESPITHVSFIPRGPAHGTPIKQSPTNTDKHRC